MVVLLMVMTLSTLQMLMILVYSSLFSKDLGIGMLNKLRRAQSGLYQCKTQMVGIQLLILTRWKINSSLNGLTKWQVSVTVQKSLIQALLMLLLTLWKEWLMLASQSIIHLFNT